MEKRAKYCCWTQKRFIRKRFVFRFDTQAALSCILVYLKNQPFRRFTYLLLCLQCIQYNEYGARVIIRGLIFPLSMVQTRGR